MSTPKLQLGFVGEFPASYADQAQRLSLQRQGNFSPDTTDFEAALKQCKHIKIADIARTPTIGEVLKKISSRPAAGIARIDVHTHAGTGRIGLSGVVEVRREFGGYSHRVIFADDTTGNLLKSPNLERGILNEMTKDDQAKEALDKARRPFTKDAELHIYACNAGLTQGTATPLAQVIADVLGVKTYLFLAELGYHLKESGKWGFHLRYIVPGRDPVTRGFNTKLTAEFDDYRDLDQLTQYITSASPTKPTK